MIFCRNPSKTLKVLLKKSNTVRARYHGGILKSLTGSVESIHIYIYVSFMQNTHTAGWEKKGFTGPFGLEAWALFLMQEWHRTGLEQQPGPCLEGVTAVCMPKQSSGRCLSMHRCRTGELLGIRLNCFHEKIKNQTHVCVSFISDTKTTIKFMDFLWRNQIHPFYRVSSEQISSY